MPDHFKKSVNARGLKSKSTFSDHNIIGLEIKKGNLEYP